MANPTSRYPTKFHDYDGFVEKFKPKKTTDDCYTLPNIYEAVAEYVEQTYKINRENFVRPFYPGGDFEHYEYKEGAVVVDNPPFSIMAKILAFYEEHNIKYFLFSQTQTAMGHCWRDNYTAIILGVQVIYENGANVNTSFVTNMEPEIIARSDPKLYVVLKEINDQNRKEQTAQHPKYVYPNEVCVFSSLQYCSRYGERLNIRRDNTRYIRVLDSQRKYKKHIYGSGLLLSEKTAAEKAAAEKAAEKAAAEKAVAEKAAEKAGAMKWQLSEREWAIIKELGQK